MALIPSTPLIAEVDMGGASDPSSSLTVRATVVQAATVFYDTPATLGPYLWLFHPLCQARVSCLCASFKI